MVVVEFRRPTHDPEGRVDGSIVVTRLTVTGSSAEYDLKVEGDEDDLDLTERVLNLRTGAVIRLQDDPEEWVRGLAGAYRSPYLWAEIVEDTTPLEDVDVVTVAIEDPAEVHDAVLH